MASLQQCCIERLTVCCFGYGKELQLDFDILRVLSETTHGVFKHIVHPEELQSVFVSAYKSRVLARDLRVSLKVLRGSVLCDITQVYSDNGQDFSLHTLGANQQVPLIFLLKPRYSDLDRPVCFPTVQITLTYQNCEGMESSQITTLDVQFTEWGPEAVHVAEVDVYWQQARGVACLLEVKRLALSGEMEEAKQCLEREIEVLTRSGYASHAAVQSVLSQLKEAQLCTASSVCA